MTQLTRILALDTIIGVVACLLTLGLDDSARQHIPAQFLHSLSAAYLIGTPTLLLLTRYGITVYRLRFPFNWLIICTVILLCTAGGLLIHGLVLLMSGSLQPGQFWSTFRARAQFAGVLAMLFGIGAVVYRVMRTDLEATLLELKTRQLEQERAGKLAVEAQLASLESHVRPHFLFNTLNTISSLIPDDPKRAEADPLDLQVVVDEFDLTIQ